MLEDTYAISDTEKSPTRRSFRASVHRGLDPEYGSSRGRERVFRRSKTYIDPFGKGTFLEVVPLSCHRTPEGVSASSSQSQAVPSLAIPEGWRVLGVRKVSAYAPVATW